MLRWLAVINWVGFHSHVVFRVGLRALGLLRCRAAAAAALSCAWWVDPGVDVDALELTVEGGGGVDRDSESWKRRKKAWMR